MGMRWVVGVVALTMVLFLVVPSVWAADGETAEAAQVGLVEANRDQILQTIEATRQTDPDLAAEMERQLDLMESGEKTDTEGDVHGGEHDEEDPRFQQVQSDPRMQAVREQYESGQLTEDQAREQVFEILRDYGLEPADGREWEQHEGELRGGVGLELEHGEGFERALEHMSPEAREQMERLFEHEGEHPEMDREMFERYHETSERYVEPTERTYEASNEYQLPEPEHHGYEQPPQP